jgi:hypothetical protein
MGAAQFQSVDDILAEVLSAKKQFTLWDQFLKSVGLQKLQHAILREHLRKQEPGFVPRLPRLFRIVHSNYFEISIGIVFLLNAALIGFQVCQDETDVGTTFAFILEIMDSIFAVIFTLEIILYLIVDGWIWLFDWQHFFDLSTIIVTVLVPNILATIGEQSVILRAFSVLRLLRLVRLLKKVRTWKLFRIFWALVQGIINSGRLILFTYITMGGVIFIIAVFCVYLIGNDPTIAANPDISFYFQDVPNAMLTILQVSTCDNWTWIVREHSKSNSWCGPLMILSILLITLSGQNLVTAVICNEALARAQADEDMKAVEQREKAAQEVNELERLFAEIDEDGSGMLSKEEYFTAISSNVLVKEKFAFLEIGNEEAKEIWDFVDIGTGEVSPQMFVSVFRALKGEAKAKDSFAIMKRIGQLSKKVERMTQELESHQGYVKSMKSTALLLEEEMGRTFIHAAAFMQSLSKCVPPDPVPLNPRQIEKFHKSLQERVEKTLYG